MKGDRVATVRPPLTREEGSTARVDPQSSELPRQREPQEGSEVDVVRESPSRGRPTKADSPACNNGVDLHVSSQKTPRARAEARVPLVNVARGGRHKVACEVAHSQSLTGTGQRQRNGARWTLTDCVLRFPTVLFLLFFAFSFPALLLA